MDIVLKPVHPNVVSDWYLAPGWRWAHDLDQMKVMKVKTPSPNACIEGQLCKTQADFSHRDRRTVVLGSTLTKYKYNSDSVRQR